MTQQNSPEHHPQFIISDSINGIAKMLPKPENAQTHSLNEVAKLQPQVPNPKSSESKSSPSMSSEKPESIAKIGD
jgi:hypothetical protein